MNFFHCIPGLLAVQVHGVLLRGEDGLQVPDDLGLPLLQHLRVHRERLVDLALGLGELAVEARGRRLEALEVGPDLVGLALALLDELRDGLEVVHVVVLKTRAIQLGQARHVMAVETMHKLKKVFI